MKQERRKHTKSWTRAEKQKGYHQTGKKGVGASRTSRDETKDNNNKTRLFRFRFDYIDGRGEHPHNTQ